jgi:hypothetical protein
LAAEIIANVCVSAIWSNGYAGGQKSNRDGRSNKLVRCGVDYKDPTLIRSKRIETSNGSVRNIAVYLDLRAAENCCRDENPKDKNEHPFGIARPTAAPSGVRCEEAGFGWKKSRSVFHKFVSGFCRFSESKCIIFRGRMVLIGNLSAYLPQRMGRLIGTEQFAHLRHVIRKLAAFLVRENGLHAASELSIPGQALDLAAVILQTGPRGRFVQPARIF